ncbi:MAG: DUF3426 domain-containing protein [Thiobacillus sp.]|nr:DUF3426 domain-containing protein [Thiobacillus sp.]
MNYRTTCPHCVSIFRLGPDQLDAAQGWVQCSVCGAAFDAHPSLLMADGSPLPPPEPAAPDPLTPAPVETAQPASERVASAAPDEATAGENVPAAAAQGPELDATPVEASESDVASTPQGIAQRETPLDLPSIILIDPDADASDDPGPLPHISAPAYPAPQETSTYPPPPAYPASAPGARVEYAGDAPAEAMRAYVAPPRRRMPIWIGLVASLVLLAALLAQTVYFLRDPLVSRFPQMRPALEQSCEIVGCTLSLPTNLDLLRIVGSDLQTEASGRLKLTLTLGNRAGHAQAWPVLVLTLMDQRNRPLARRSFAPSEYLGDMQRIANGIPARSEQGLTLPLNVKDLKPMGFDLRLTY